MLENKYVEIDKNLNRKKEDKSEFGSSLMIPNLKLYTD